MQYVSYGYSETCHFCIEKLKILHHVITQFFDSNGLSAG
jgi:hypothetical protein